MRTGRPRKSVDVECVCVGCGNKFTVPDWKIKMGRGKFCSHACYYKPGAHRERPSLVITPEMKLCLFCGQGFLVGGFGRARRERRFCSQSCSTRYKYREHILKGGSKKGHHIKSRKISLAATLHPTTADIAWISGIYEGEGWVVRVRPGLPAVSIGQKDRWMLDKARDLFGGSVNVGKDFYTWHLHGSAARGFLMTIYSFLSPRRQEQVARSLGKFPVRVNILDSCSTELILAWAAGVFDGEGYSIRLKNRNGERLGTQQVGVGQKDRWLCDRLQSLFGGRVYDCGIVKYDRIVGKRNFKGEHAGYKWDMTGGDARDFLRAIYDRLSPRRQEKIREILEEDHIDLTLATN